MWLFIWIGMSLMALLGMSLSMGYSIAPYVGALVVHGPLPVLCAVQASRIRDRMERDGQW